MRLEPKVGTPEGPFQPKRGYENDLEEGGDVDASALPAGNGAPDRGTPGASRDVSCTGLRWPGRTQRGSTVLLGADAVSETPAAEAAAAAVQYLKPRAQSFADCTVEDSGLKDYLLHAQRMQHVLLLVGSGASLSAGGPSMWDLWTAIVGDPPEGSGAAVLDLVGYAGEANPNIEELLSRCDAWLQINENHPKYSSVISFRLAAITKILELCKLAGQDHTQLGPHEDLLRKLCRRRSRDHRLRIFTTNYDLCLEHAASNLGITLLDGFSFSWPRRFDPRFLEMDIVERQADQSEPGPFVSGAALYMKLHGSVNWSSDEKHRTTIIDAPTAESACIVYPARTKYQKSYTTPYFDLMSRFLAALRQPNTCLITIGFGFNDDHFTHPIEQAVKTNPHFRLVAVAPGAADAPNAWERFRTYAKAGRDVMLVKATLQTFVEQLPAFTALSPAEQLLETVKRVTK